MSFFDLYLATKQDSYLFHYGNIWNLIKEESDINGWRCYNDQLLTIFFCMTIYVIMFTAIEWVLDTELTATTKCNEHMM